MEEIHNGTKPSFKNVIKFCESEKWDNKIFQKKIGFKK